MRHHIGHVSFAPLRLRGRPFEGLGGWRGKPLHPPLASVPLGTVVAALVFDVASALAVGSRSLDRELYRSATFTLAVGQVFVGLAVLTGWWDRRRLTRRGNAARAVANAHGWVMLAFGTLTFGDLLVRRSFFPAAGHTPPAVLVLTALASLCAVVGGTLGGALTFEHGLAVERDIRAGSTPAPIHSAERNPNELPLDGRVEDKSS